jgi:hypothetical protein
MEVSHDATYFIGRGGGGLCGGCWFDKCPWRRDHNRFVGYGQAEGDSRRFDNEFRSIIYADYRSAVATALLPPVFELVLPAVQVV